MSLFEKAFLRYRNALQEFEVFVPTDYFRKCSTERIFENLKIVRRVPRMALYVRSRRVIGGRMLTYRITPDAHKPPLGKLQKGKIQSGLGLPKAKRVESPRKGERPPDQGNRQPPAQ